MKRETIMKERNKEINQERKWKSLLPNLQSIRQSFIRPICVNCPTTQNLIIGFPQRQVRLGIKMLYHAVFMASLSMWQFNFDISDVLNARTCHLWLCRQPTLIFSSCSMFYTTTQLTRPLFFFRYHKIAKWDWKQREIRLIKLNFLSDLAQLENGLKCIQMSSWSTPSQSTRNELLSVLPILQVNVYSLECNDVILTLFWTENRRIGHGGAYTPLPAYNFST